MWPDSKDYKSNLVKDKYAKYKLDKISLVQYSWQVSSTKGGISMRFVGRKRELRALENAFQSHDSSFIPIYGRRRVGKSELIKNFIKLIKNFIKNKKALYFYSW